MGKLANKIKIIFCISLILAVNTYSVVAKEYQSKMLQTILLEIERHEMTYLSRNMCVSSIMQVIGVTDTEAEEYAYALYDQPVFYDIGSNNINDGYIILAKFSNIAIGVNVDEQNIGNFEPNRAVTIKECLAFMLRCLKDPTTVEWKNIISNAEEIGLLKADEAQNLDADEALTGSTFIKLLERMINMNRYLYWPTEESRDGYAKSVQIDKTNSIRYIDWILEKETRH